MRYRALGEVEAVRDGAGIGLGGANQRRLLAVLLADVGHPIPTGIIADALWPEAAPDAASARVQTVVSRLRRALGELADDIVTTPDGYRLAVNADGADCSRFEDLVERARGAPLQTALNILDEALGLWRGPAFGSLADLAPVRLAATRLDELRLTAAEDRLALMLDLGKYTAAIPDLEELVLREPLRERLRAQLMKALYWTGRQAEALEAYTDYRNLLGEDLGLDPSPELRTLHEQIARGSLPPVTPEPTGPRTDGPTAAEDPGTAAAQAEQAGWDALWAGDHDGSVEARQAAYVQLLRGGDRPGAARLAIWLSVDAAIRLKDTVAVGWFGRAERLLEGVPPGPAHALLTALGGLIAILHGELDVAIERATIAQSIGESAGDLDSQALGRVIEGWARVRTGERSSGMALVDEAMASAVAGELSPYVTGLVYCRTLCACLDLMDFERATQWTDEINRLRDSGGPADLPGDCRTHRVTILLFTGDWEACEEQAHQACEQTGDFDMTHLALNEASLGELFLRRGDLDGAGERFARARELGGSPYPGLAMLRLAEGDAAAAAEEIANQLRDATDDPLVRARLLPAAVEIALATDDLAAASDAADDLAGIADRFGTSALHAEALSARGLVRLAEGEPANALRSLRAARKRWQDVGSEYRAARTRLHLAEAYAASGRDADATAAAAAAAFSLKRIGAATDAARAEALAAVR